MWIGLCSIWVRTAWKLALCVGSGEPWFIDVVKDFRKTGQFIFSTQPLAPWSYVVTEEILEYGSALVLGGLARLGSPLFAALALEAKLRMSELNYRNSPTRPEQSRPD